MLDSNRPPERELRRVEPAPTMPGRNGGTLRCGNPGNRGNLRGRTTIKTIVRASQDLDAELGRLRRLSHAGKMRTPVRIAYARLLFEIVLAGKGAEEPPVGILVATGSPADFVTRRDRGD